MKHAFLGPLAAIDDVFGMVEKGADWAGTKTLEATGSPLAATAVNVGIQAVPMLAGSAEAGGAKAAEEAAAEAARAAMRAKQYLEVHTSLKWSDVSDGVKALLSSVAKDANDLDGLDPKAVERVARAHSQNVPITRGQATRDPAQLGAEANLMKTQAGKGLVQTRADQDAALHHNLALIRGDVAPTAKATTTTGAGQSVQGAARRKLQVLEAQKNRLYTKARKDGETAAPVDIAALKEWLSQPVNQRHAGFLNSAIGDYEKGGRVSVNDLENIRKEAVAYTLGPPSEQGHYAGEAIGKIDEILDRSGGSVYKAARRANRDIKEEFDRQSAIKALTGSKTGTTDRRVALEDTVDQVLLRGSADDLRKVKQTLTQGGTEQTRKRGAQGWADLQAAGIDYLREKAGGARRITNADEGQQFQSQFLDALHDMDRDGKLDVLFGERAAQRIRLLSKTVTDVRTTPALGIAGSDTMANILNTMERVSKIPLIGDVTSAVVRGAKAVRDIGKGAREAAKAKVTPLEEAAARHTKKAPRGLLPGAIGGEELRENLSDQERGGL